MRELLIAVDNVEPTIVNVNEAVEKFTGLHQLYESQEEMDEAIKDGFLEFKNGTMYVYIE